MIFDLAQWFKELYIHEDVWDSPTAVRVRSLLRVEAQKVKARPYADQEGALSGVQFDLSKQRLYLSRHVGHFFRKCPGAQGAACCNYFVLNLGAQCNMNCSYCYLQSYINSPLTQIYTNLDEALLELEGRAKEFPNAPFRVGTGEVIDSLSLDDLTLYSQKLVRWFKQYPHLTLEFKTKSNNIKNFVNEEHAGNVVVSFSINPQEIVSAEEHRTASLKERLQAARLCRDKGFPVAFHIDPMIYTPQWQEQYAQLTKEVCALFEPQDVKWISVGALRFQPDMKSILRERFGQTGSQVLSAEMFLSKDGKMRYDQNLRNEMFKFVTDQFRQKDRKYPIFLCMESPESWLGTFGSTPRKVDDLDPLFKPMPLV